MHIKWFEKKNNGLYFLPITWQGWLLTATYIICAVISFRNIDAASDSASDTLLTFIPIFIVYTIVMYLIALNTSGKFKLK